MISFEPLPANLVFLRRHLALNRIENCTVVNAAVSSTEGNARFTTAGCRSMTHLLADAEPEHGDIPVRVVTLDGMVGRGEIPPPTVIKCDTEGAEMSLLEGAEAVLRAHHPSILLDTHGRNTQSLLQVSDGPGLSPVSTGPSAVGGK